MGPTQRPLTIVKVAGHEAQALVLGSVALLHAQMDPKLALPVRTVIILLGQMTVPPMGP